MFGCKRKATNPDVRLALEQGRVINAVLAPDAATDVPHTCEATIKLALKEYDERRTEALKDWKGIENPYRIRRDEALGVFLVERAEENLPWTSERALEWGREAATRAFVSGWKRAGDRGDYAWEQTRTLIAGEIPSARVDWTALGPSGGFVTHDAAFRWLLQFIDPAHGTTEYTADGFPATTPKAAPKSKPRKG